MNLFANFNFNFIQYENQLYKLGKLGKHFGLGLVVSKTYKNMLFSYMAENMKHQNVCTFFYLLDTFLKGILYYNCLIKQENPLGILIFVMVLTMLY